MFPQLKIFFLELNPKFPGIQWHFLESSNLLCSRVFELAMLTRTYERTYTHTHTHTHIVYVCGSYYYSLNLYKIIYYLQNFGMFTPPCLHGKNVYMPKTGIFATLNFTNLKFYYCKYLYVINFEFHGISWNFFISRKLPGKHPDFPKFGKFPSKWKH